METPIGYTDGLIDKTVRMLAWQRATTGGDTLLPDTLRVSVGTLKFVQFDKDAVRVQFEGTTLLTLNRSTHVLEFYDANPSRIYPTS